ncbi:hypothetical protein JL722_10544 [Aureococcus anophagefferens]|nr:hypothetical protein JL722_10544 [Aureococcus anophagefferens]
MEESASSSDAASAAPDAAPDAPMEDAAPAAPAAAEPEPEWKAPGPLGQWITRSVLNEASRSRTRASKGRRDASASDAEESEYEKHRRERIEANQAFLQSLGFTGGDAGQYNENRAYKEAMAEKAADDAAEKARRLQRRLDKRQKKKRSVDELEKQRKRAAGPRGLWRRRGALVRSGGRPGSSSPARALECVVAAVLPCFPDEWVARKRTKLLEAVENVAKRKEAKWFKKPVDHVALGLTDYPKVVKKPMDLGTVSDLVLQGAYDNDGCGGDRSFDDDLRLPFSNAILYNEADSDVAVCAAALLVSDGDATAAAARRGAAAEDRKDLKVEVVLRLVPLYMAADARAAGPDFAGGGEACRAALGAIDWHVWHSGFVVDPFNPAGLPGLPARETVVEVLDDDGDGRKMVLRGVRRGRALKPYLPEWKAARLLPLGAPDAAPDAAPKKKRKRLLGRRARRRRRRARPSGRTSASSAATSGTSSFWTRPSRPRPRRRRRRRRPPPRVAPRQEAGRGGAAAAPRARGPARPPLPLLILGADAAEPDALGEDEADAMAEALSAIKTTESGAMRPWRQVRRLPRASAAKLCVQLSLEIMSDAGARRRSGVGAKTAEVAAPGRGEALALAVLRARDGPREDEHGRAHPRERQARHQRALTHAKSPARRASRELHLALALYVGNAAGPCKETAARVLDVHGTWHLGAGVAHKSDAVKFTTVGGRIEAVVEDTSDDAARRASVGKRFKRFLGDGFAIGTVLAYDRTRRSSPSLGDGRADERLSVADVHGGLIAQLPPLPPRRASRRPSPSQSRSRSRARPVPQGRQDRQVLNAFNG